MQTDEHFIEVMGAYTRDGRKMASGGKMYTPPGTSVRGVTLPPGNRRPSDIILYGVSCKELSSKDGLERFMKWLREEALPAIDPKDDVDEHGPPRF